MTDAARRTAWAVTVTGAVAFVVVAWWQVPWHPVPGGLPRPAAVDTVLSDTQVARAERYAWWARAWSWSSLAVSLAVACWLGFTRVGATLVGRVRGPWPWRVLVAVALCAGLGRLATLPFAAAGQQHRLDAGLATQSWPAWAWELAVGLAVSVLAASVALVVLVGCARRWRTAWPAVAGLLVGGMVLLGSFVYPVLVEPLTNDFRELPDGELRSEVLAVADAEGVPVDEVLVSDASRRTTTLNAYVSGYGSTRRVVLFDTLLDDADRGEVLSVVAHELAHARHDDVLVGSVLGALGAATGVGLLALLLGRRRGRVDPARDPSRPEVVPRVLALVAVAGLLASPVQSTISRLVETRADVDALAATDDPASFVALQRRLAVRSLADPTPPAWSQVWFGTHPTLLERVALARRGAVSSRSR
ncbi:M48 family metallopeptidase [Nocardioides sp. GXQ0305]|uniref:M48 family metallopeptidase n=1 Tax=Nocardioides sp. GXQ0305 TaxID=3423912 RepID=UPI003D7E4953